MADKRQFEVMFLRLVPHTLRDDFMTVGLVMVEPGKEFAEARFTRDWKRVGCFAPESGMEILELAEPAVQEALVGIKSRGDLLRVLENRFGTAFDVSPVKGLVAEDPAVEMGILERDYLAATRPQERSRGLGRAGIVHRMKEAFAEKSVLGLLQQDLEMKEFTGESDPFQIDFGFRLGRSLKMFHALALNLSREPAVTLAYRYMQIQNGLKKQNVEGLLMAIINEQTIRTKDPVASGVAMLETRGIEVRDVSEMGAVAEEVRAVLRA